MMLRCLQVMYPEHIDGFDLRELDISEFLNPPTEEEVKNLLFCGIGSLFGSFVSLLF